ncbi:GIY-YIG nuclease family protein [Metabacillus litoralis]|uniref:GIY-YIG nuclease family protein n=1 Tax=Metabacillus TaxID=2675233 RepID=UPI001B97C6C9|nr:GIY-YIG nuclease family protein [Metabacillus litoralis]UHA58858.1 GIY-YIG nuclease family protein [Metabacillus litoralis]
MSGRTIQIFLPFGSPRGIKIAEITNRTVQAILIPRNKIDEAGQRPEVKNVGVYLLFGQDEDDANPKVYIGEAENCFERLKQHNRDKDFWDVAIVIVTNNKQNQFTKSDVKFLERTSYEIALNRNRYKLDQTVPANSFVPEWRQYDLNDILETIKLLLSTLGYPLFEELRKTKETDNPIIQKDHIFFCKGKGVEAKGEYNEEGFVVIEGSQMSKETSNSIHNYLITIRENLLNENIVTIVNGIYTFRRDHLFSSPSQAASIVLGRNGNGWIEWKNIDGVTLDSIKRKGVE